MEVNKALHFMPVRCFLKVGKYYTEVGCDTLEQLPTLTVLGNKRKMSSYSFLDYFTLK